MNIAIRLQAFRANLVQARKARGFSQEELASRCGLDRTFISMIERGKRTPTLSTIIKLSIALECNIELLFKGVCDDY